jgi:hypothetical protein
MISLIVVWEVCHELHELHELKVQELTQSEKEIPHIQFSIYRD